MSTPTPDSAVRRIVDRLSDEEILRASDALDLVVAVDISSGWCARERRTILRAMLVYGDIVSGMVNSVRDDEHLREARFAKLVNRIADWTNDEVKVASPDQVRHIARLVRDGADPVYPPFASLAEAKGAAS